MSISRQDSGSLLDEASYNSSCPNGPVTVHVSSTNNSALHNNKTLKNLDAPTFEAGFDNCSELQAVDIEETTLAAVPVCLEFRNINCLIPSRDPATVADRLALDDVSGVARAGEILAIMGASGSGKTTLLNILCHRHELSPPVVAEDHLETLGDISPSSSSSLNTHLMKQIKHRSVSGLIATGHIMLNGQQGSRQLFRSYGAYVTQQDLLLKTFSPRESLAFSGDLTLPDHYTDEQRSHVVEKIISELKLEKCADNPVGDVRSPGVSGGERKRTAIAIEMISNPSVLCLDEPTSGLDSSTAIKVVEVLKDLARNGRTIILTIHQPSTELFALFDSLLILSHGKTVYFGPAQNSRSYFSSFGMSIPVTTNPADAFLRLIEGQADDDDDDFSLLDIGSKEQCKAIVDAALDAAFKKEYLKFIQLDLETKSSTDDLPFLAIRDDRQNRRPLWTEVIVLGKRAMKNYWRQSETTAAQITQVLFCAFLVGLLFFNIGTNQDSISSRKGVIFEIMMNLFMTSFSATACSFPAERPLFLKEKANNLYSTSVYFWSKVVLELMFQCIWPALYIIIVYFMIGFQATLGNFFWFLLISLMLANISSALALIIASFLPNPDFTMQTFAFLICPLTLFIALFISDDTIPDYYIWMQWISPFHYAYEIFCIIEFDGLVFSCEDSDLVESLSGSLICPYTSGISVLQTLGIDPADLGTDVACLAVLYGVYIAGAYAALSWRKEKV